MKKILFMCAALSIASVVMITIFVFAEGIPVMQKVGLFHFIFGSTWNPAEGVYGIFPMIIGSFAITAGALVLSIPLGIFTSIFLAELAPKNIVKITSAAIELLAGIPSVIYGLFGMTVIVPMVRKLQNVLWSGKSYPGQSGYSILAASIVLSIMVLPTIINISKDALKSVGKELKEASLALGATHWQTIRHVILPKAKSGIFAGIVLGLGRAIGETMAVIMVAGNTTALPKSLFSPVRSLTGNIAIEIAYAGPGEHTQALFATGIVLFTVIIVINGFAMKILRKG